MAIMVNEVSDPDDQGDNDPDDQGLLLYLFFVLWEVDRPYWSDFQ